MKQQTEGSVYNGKINVGEKHQVKNMPSYFLDAPGPGNAYEGMKNTYAFI